MNGWRCEFCTIEAQRVCADPVCVWHEAVTALDDPAVVE